MKLFILLLLVFITSNVMAQPLPAESQYQVGKNLLTNGGFEQGKKGWTSSAGTFNVTTANGAVDGVAGCVTLSSQTLSLTNLSAFNVANLKGDATVSVEAYSTVEGVQVCSVVDNVEIDCVPIAKLSTWENSVQIGTVFGSTNYGVRLKTSGNVTGTVCADEAKVVKQTFVEVSQAQLAGTSFWAAGTCTQTRTSSTPGAMTGVAGCPGPTVEIQNSGSWATTDADLIRQTITNLPAGDYVASFQFVGFNSASTNGQFYIYDGTTLCKGNTQTPATNASSFNIRCPFKYTSSGTRVFEIYASSSASTLTVSNESGTGVSRDTRFTLEYYPPSSKIISQQNNQDTDWVDCGLTTSDFTGFGTVSNIEDLCKKDGADLLVQTKFTVGTSTAVEARINLKLLGTALTSASSAIIPSLKLVGQAGRGTSSTDSYLVLAEPSVSYMTFGRQTGVSGSNAKRLGTELANSGETFTIHARIPINNWTKSAINGTFYEMVQSPGSPKPKTCFIEAGGAGSLTSQTVCTSSPCTEYLDTCNSLSITRVGTGDYVLAGAAGTCKASARLKCDIKAGNAVNYIEAVGVYTASTFATDGSGGFSWPFATFIRGGAAANTFMTIHCDCESP